LSAATRSLAAFLAISLVMRARACSSSVIGSVLGDRGVGAGFAFCPEPGRANRHREKIHTTSVNRTETSQRIRLALGENYTSGQFEKRTIVLSQEKKKKSINHR
jgi:hypothetical protein